LVHAFDELVWFDATEAVSPAEGRETTSLELPETYPFGL
jgi:hypothetical protein